MSRIRYGYQITGVDEGGRILRAEESGCRIHRDLEVERCLVSEQ